MEYVATEFDELCSFEEGSGSRGRLGRSPGGVHEPEVYKSKNIHAERKRRQRISERLLILRSLVPIITNMNKSTIIDDAVTYIEKMQNSVKELSDQLLEMESYSEEEEAKLKSVDEIYSKQEMAKSGIEADVQVTSIDGEKLWIKIVLEKKRGVFTKLMEAMNFLGLEVTDTSVTTSKGAVLITSCVEGIFGGKPGVEQIRELLMDIIRSM